MARNVKTLLHSPISKEENTPGPARSFAGEVPPSASADGLAAVLAACAPGRHRQQGDLGVGDARMRQEAVQVDSGASGAG